MEDHSEKILTVGEYLEVLNEYIKPVNFSIIGEVSSVTDRSGGAVFFSVSDEEEQAVLNCVIWRNVYRGLGFKLEEGMKIKMTGHPNIYKPRGSLSYVARSIIPTGEGALLKAFEKLKETLKKEGFFAPERKQRLPNYITKIGLITAKQSDAIKDFETHLGNFGAQVYVHDVRVEGFSAVENIVKAIKAFNESSLAREIDVLVLTRGGGSLESLQAFNSEAVARAIYSSKIPVLSAIGHERDVTISDLVADVRGSTPTDAGEILSKDWREAESKIQTTQEKIFSRFKRQLITDADYVAHQKERIIDKFERLIQNRQSYVRRLSTNLFINFRGVFHRFGKLSQKFQMNSMRFEALLKKQRSTVQRSRDSLIRGYAQIYKIAKTRLKQAERLLESNDPQKKLEQGYSIMRNEEGKVIKAVKSITKGDILVSELTDGKVKSQVEEISAS
ncbi:exodeoxyribonuclease VII large subunit [candidate division WWE3 bacterium]|nr:exodeoxyribonuclease VII large subunit [candidate division WWE3 bacterium]